MKQLPALLSLLLVSLFLSCQTNPGALPIEGTWELISATAQEKDSTFSTFDSTRSMIKILNRTHFAFLNHARTAREDSATAPFYAGGGTYTLTDSVYTEHLDYFSDPAWENHTFPFVVSIDHDTLVQKGEEKIEERGIERVIIEKYKRVATPARK